MKKRGRKREKERVEGGKKGGEDKGRRGRNVMSVSLQFFE